MALLHHASAGSTLLERRVILNAYSGVGIVANLLSSRVAVFYLLEAVIVIASSNLPAYMSKTRLFKLCVFGVTFSSIITLTRIVHMGRLRMSSQSWISSQLSVQLSKATCCYYSSNFSAQRATRDLCTELVHSDTNFDRLEA